MCIRDRVKGIRKRTVNSVHRNSHDAYGISVLSLMSIDSFWDKIIGTYPFWQLAQLCACCFWKVLGGCGSDMWYVRSGQMYFSTNINNSDPASLKPHDIKSRACFQVTLVSGKWLLITRGMQLVKIDMVQDINVQDKEHVKWVFIILSLSNLLIHRC